MASLLTQQDSKTAAKQSVSLLGASHTATRAFTFSDDFAVFDSQNTWSVSHLTGNSAVTAGLLDMNSGADATARSYIFGQRRYAVRSDSELLYSARVRLPEVQVADNERSWGLESSDRAERLEFFMDGITFKARVMSNSAELYANTITAPLDMTKLHDFEIRASKGEVRFSVDGGDLQGSYTSRGKTVAMLRANSVAAFFRAINTGNADERGIQSDSVQIGRYPDPWQGRLIQMENLILSGQMFNGAGLLVTALVNDTITPPTLNFYNGTGIGGDLIMTQGITAGWTEGINHHIGPIEFADGCYVDFSASGNYLFGFVQ